MKQLLSFSSLRWQASLSFFLIFFINHTLTAQCLDGTCWDGYGIYVYPSGARYQGNFRNGKIHGEGILYFSNGNKYIGDWKNHYREGEGELYYTDGGKYTGQFKGSRFNGKGVFNYPNGDKYRGNWKNDLAEGLGIYAFKDGDRYEGEFRKGKFDGQGTMFYKDGAKYTGQWKKNKKNGAGIFVSTDGKKHHGTWAAGTLVTQPEELATEHIASNTAAPTPSKDKLRDCNTEFCKTGKGRFTYSDGSRYVGDFLNGAPLGKGTCYYKNGDKYVGGWKNHAPHGEGIMYYHYGKVLGATWDNGNVLEVVHNNHEMTVGTEHIEQDKSKKVKIWAVLVGVARYEHLPVLKYTDDDAYRLYAFLKSPEGGALPDQQMRILIDEDATRNNILRTLKQVFYQADENDVVLFYFSGHGYDGSFIPSDYDGYNNLLYHTEIKEILEKSAAKHKICFADACHSGSAGDTDLLAMRSTFNPNSLDRYYRAFENSRGGIALLLSSKGEEFSLEDEGLRQGIFSHYLMRGLKGEADTNQNEIVTIDEIFKYVHQEVRSYTANAQTPILSGNYDKNMPVAVIGR